jgi:lactate permease
MDVSWVQNYDPLNSAFWSPAVASLPILLLSGMLLAGLSAPRAAIAGLLTALGVATIAFKMPMSPAMAAAGYGACFGLMPIGWIVVSAVFLYNLTVRSGQFEIIRHSVAAISPDRRIQALLIAYSFGSFLEGAAGFGAPVAISAALLIGLGFSPLYAAGLTLLANTSPVAFGSLGIPIRTLAQVSGLDEMALSQMAGRQLPFFSMMIPAWLVAVMSGWRGVKGCWPAIVVSGGSFATFQFCASNFHGPLLVDVLGGIGSLVSLAIFLRFWQPKEIWRFPDEADTDRNAGPVHVPSARQTAYAWTPWVMLSVMICVWSLPVCKGAMDRGVAKLASAVGGLQKTTVAVPGLHGVVYRTEPAVPVPSGSDRADKPEKADYDWNIISSSGTSVLVAAILSAFWLRLPLGDVWQEFCRTLYGVRWALCTIACMLAIAFTMKFSGADVTLGLAFVHTGWFYPFFAPLLGWLGVIVTGSDTSTNAMFGSLQRVTAERLGLNPVLIVASNSTGGVMGKMIAAQSIVVAAAATKQNGSEGRILRFVFLHSIALAALIGLLTMFQAYCWTAVVPMAATERPTARASSAGSADAAIKDLSGHWGQTHPRQP